MSVKRIATAVALVVGVAMVASTPRLLYDADEWFQPADAIEPTLGDRLPGGPVCLFSVPEGFDGYQYLRAHSVGKNDLGGFSLSDFLMSEDFTIDLDQLRTVLVNPQELDQFYGHYGTHVVPGNMVLSDIRKTIDYSRRVLEGEEPIELEYEIGRARVRLALYEEMADSLNNCLASLGADFGV